MNNMQRQISFGSISGKVIHEPRPIDSSQKIQFQVNSPNTDFWCQMCALPHTHCGCTFTASPAHSCQEFTGSRLSSSYENLNSNDFHRRSFSDNHVHTGTAPSVAVALPYSIPPSPTPNSWAPTHGFPDTQNRDQSPIASGDVRHVSNAATVFNACQFDSPPPDTWEREAESTYGSRRGSRETIGAKSQVAALISRTAS